MRKVVAAAVACVSFVGLSVGGDVQASIKKSINIPAGGLGPALHTLSEERRIHFVFLAEDVSKLSSKGASGNLTINEALNQLLNGTGLTYQYIDNETVSIVPITAAPAPGRTTDASMGSGSGSFSASTENVTTKHSDQGSNGLWQRFRLAQAETTSQSDTSGKNSAVGISAESESAVTISEIIVTSQRIEQKLQDVPISISVLGGAELDRSNLSVVDQINRVPGMASGEAGYYGSKRLTVRGVSSTSDAFAGTSTVGYYLDTVPFGFVRQSFVPDSNAYDLERVEVLRGPQGTLYGVSAVNGVVRILTKDADLEDLALKFRVTGSATKDGGQGYRTDGAINVPIVSGKLAARAVVGYEETPGWIDGPFGKDSNDGENFNARLKVKAALSDDLSASAMVWHSDADMGGRSISAPDHTTIALDQSISNEFDVYALKVEYELPTFTLSSATSYIDYVNSTDTSLSIGTTQELFSEFHSKNLSQELALSSTSGGPWRWTLGGIYRDVEDSVAQRIPGVFANPRGLAYNDYSESFAVFGELTRMLLDGKIELTGGVRYFEDHNKVKQRISPVGLNAPLINDRSDKFDRVSPRVVVTAHPSEALTLYSSYAEGFRSGFVQSPSVLAGNPNFPSVAPDNLKNYELGAKGSLVDGLVSFEGAVYYMQWDGVQQQVTVPLIPGGTTQVSALVNAKTASGPGAEMMLVFHPTSGLDLGAGYSWNALEFDYDVTSLVGGQPIVLAAEGSRLANSPEHSANAFLDYRFPVGTLEGAVGGSVNYLSGRLARAILAGVARQNTSDDLWMARASFGVSSPENGWSASLFVENLTDNQDIAAPLPPGQSIASYEFRARPRTVGLQFDYRFGPN